MTSQQKLDQYYPKQYLSRKYFFTRHIPAHLSPNYGSCNYESWLLKKNSLREIFLEFNLRRGLMSLTVF